MPRPTTYQAGEGATLYVVLHAYLSRLEAIERSKPEHMRKHVPSFNQIATMVKIHPMTLSNIATNKIKHLNLETAGRIIGAVRQFGFQMEISDLIEFRDNAENQPE